MDQPRRGGVTLERAGELIGGDKPLSKRTISTYIARGDLEAYGALGGRRVTMRSIRAYQNGERGIWRDDVSDASPALAMPPRRQTKRGRPSSHDPLEGSTSDADSIPARRPKLGLIRSLPSGTKK